MARKLSHLEIILSVVVALLLLCCIGLIVPLSLSLKPRGERSFDELMDSLFRPIDCVASVAGADAAAPAVLSGQMTITEGAVFSDELHNSSSPLFKSLAFDVEKLVSSQAFILKISRGSIVLWARNKRTQQK